jgi:predicted homoserine dehydrogenase-like protein
VVATSKRPLKKGEILDGEGGATVWGKLIPAKVSLSNETLPIGLAHGIKLNKDIKEDQIITWKDVDYLSDDPTVSYRRSMEKNFRSLLD